MILRAPAIPLITIDPYFSVWSMADALNETPTTHWTCKPNRITGVLTIDGEEFCFMGDVPSLRKMAQTSVQITALSTIYSFATEKAALTLKFTSPLLADDLMIASRPVSYLESTVSSKDGDRHDITMTILADDELCLNSKGEDKTRYEEMETPGIIGARVGSESQPVLAKDGDDIRIDWGYFYLCTTARGARVKCLSYQPESGYPAHDISLDIPMDTTGRNNTLVLFAYDDIHSIEYFGDPLCALWKTNKDTIEDVIVKAADQYRSLLERCDTFSSGLCRDAVDAGGEKYAQIVTLAYRQAFAAHKICVDTEGQLLFISKECFSNGCAATVDVSYPSIPMFLLYNPELIKGMLRPIFKYAASPVWPFDFAPHDAGRYPVLNGQVYHGGTKLENQMPVEESGNMLIIMASIAIVQKNADFAREHYDFLDKWCDFLLQHGLDPDNQLCTDDFTGHLPHNCNLSIKSIMGIAGFSIVNAMLGNKQKAERRMDSARKMAREWVDMASNQDGTYRLAFDKPGSFSMKYNLVWDILFETDLFPKEMIRSEFESYINKRINPYGMPLDNRGTCTKSDWLVWCATLAEKKPDFEKMISPLWNAYNKSESRVPLTDYYSTITAKKIAFHNRTVQGGLLIKIMKEKGICSIKNL